MHLGSKWTGIMGVAAAAFGAFPVDAEVVTFLTSGVVTEIRGDPIEAGYGPINIGDPFSLRYTFDSLSPDVEPHPNTGVYAALMEVSVSIGPWIFPVAPLDGYRYRTNAIIIANDYALNADQVGDTYWFLAEAQLNEYERALAGLNLSTLLGPNPPTVLASTDLSVVPPPLEGWTFQQSAHLVYPGIVVASSVEAISVVPLPAALPLLASGLGAIAWLTRGRVRRIRSAKPPTHDQPRAWT